FSITNGKGYCRNEIVNGLECE
ncbi:hypothetical protein SNEBB_009163, partial [Seison nebaliae]